MTYKQSNESRFITIRINPDEIQRIDDAWQGKGQFFSRTQFIKAALNSMADEVIFR